MDKQIGFISGSTDVACFYVLDGNNELHEIDLGEDGSFRFIIWDECGDIDSPEVELKSEINIQNPREFVGGCEGESVYHDENCENNILHQNGVLRIRTYIIKKSCTSFMEISFLKGEKSKR